VVGCTREKSGCTREKSDCTREKRGCTREKPDCTREKSVCARGNREDVYNPYILGSRHRNRSDVLNHTLRNASVCTRENSYISYILGIRHRNGSDVLKHTFRKMALRRNFDEKFRATDKSIDILDIYTCHTPNSSEQLQRKDPATTVPSCRIQNTYRPLAKNIVGPVLSASVSNQ